MEFKQFFKAFKVFKLFQMYKSLVIRVIIQIYGQNVLIYNIFHS